MTDLKKIIKQLGDSEELTADQAREAFTIILSGEADDKSIVQFLQALKAKGETVTEITAAARVMREKMIHFDAPVEAIDVCGTGGDARSTYNISTTVALVVAACGVPVAKHGNSSITSQSGSSDVLSKLGVNIDASIDTLKHCLEEANICFLMAPRFHPEMKYVSPARKQISSRTIFNILGPLCNPAGVKRQVMGVYNSALMLPLVSVFKALGSESVMLVHGQDGIDELTVTGTSYTTSLNDGHITTGSVTPEDVGLAHWELPTLVGGDAEANAQALRGVLSGDEGAYRDAVLMNAAAALLVAGTVDDLSAGVTLAKEAIDSKRASATLDALIRVSNQ